MYLKYFSLPVAGYTSSVKGARNRQCLYRFHISDRVPFLSSFKAGIERFPWNVSYTEYA